MKVYIKGRGAFGRAYRGLYDAETNKKLYEIRKTRGEKALMEYAEKKGWEIVERLKRKSHKEADHE
jgi:hypothetical protein